MKTERFNGKLREGMFKFNVTKVARLTRNFYEEGRINTSRGKDSGGNLKRTEAREKTTLKVSKICLTVFYFKLEAS